MEHMNQYKRHITNGIHWLEVNGGEMDIAFDPAKGWVSINFDYALDGSRDPDGIRWELSKDEIESIPSLDFFFVYDNSL